ncbi:MAG: response regulator transcription factor [Muribaculaceae bacterium]
MNCNIAIISNNTIEALGIKHILEEVFSLSPNVYATLHDVPESGIDFFDFYIIGAHHFVNNLDFFLPRKAKVILLTHNGDTTNSDIKSISCCDDESHIIDTLNGIFCQAQKKTGDNANELSQRETEVLRLIASGFINKEIADKLGISINTVLTHRKNLTSKLGIRSVSGLSFYAMMNGIIAPK